MDLDAQKVRRVIIIDDSRTSLALLELAFEAGSDFQVVGLTVDPLTGLDMVKTLAPDLVTIDMCMPSMDGAALLEKMSGMTGVCKVVVSEQISKSIALAARLESLGASLCLNKSDITAGRGAFLNKIRKACDQFENAPAQLFSNTSKTVSSIDNVPRSTANLPFFGFPIPEDEELRLEYLETRRLANVNSERQFDLVTMFVAEVTDFPVCLLTFIDRDTQWIKSSFGYERSSGPRADAFCSFTIASGAQLVVPDTKADRRFCANPLVVGEPGFRTYAGHPVESSAGVRVGTLCILDRKVRPVSMSTRRHLNLAAGILGSIIDIMPALAA